MTLRERLTLGLLAAAMAAGALAWWARDPIREIAVMPPELSIAPTEAVARVIDLATEEARPSDGGRRPVAEASESIEPGEPTAAPLGTLRVLVRSQDTHELLCGVRLFLVPAGDASWSSMHASGSRGRPGAGPATGEDGVAEFEVPLGQAYALKAWNSGAEDVHVSPFSRAETRELVFELPTEHDLPFVGRVLAFEDDQPVRAARVSIAGFDDLMGLETDAEGYFDAVVPSWQKLYARVEAPGYGLAFDDVGPGHESRAQARVIRLHESARLTVLVLAPDGAPLEGVQVRLSTESRHLKQSTNPGLGFSVGDVEWSCKTGGDGWCTVADLPPYAPLMVECTKAPSLRRMEATPISLAPGETEEVVFRVGSGATIAGYLIDEARESAGGVQIWLVPAEAKVSRYLDQNHDPAAKTVTRDAGWFEFTDVADGIWWVGPAPGGLYASRAEVVEVLDGVADREVYLEGTRGLYIEGRVVDPSGAPIEEACVSLNGADEPVWLSDWTDKEGRFTVGPLAQGSFLVSATSVASGHAPSEPVLVEAGDEEVLIQLHLAGAIRGRLVDGTTRAPQKGCVRAVAAGNPTLWPKVHTTWADEAGEFELQGLEAGLYHLAADTERQEFALEANVAVAAGAPPSGVLLESWPGATIHLRYWGAQPYCWFRAKLDEAVVAAEGIERGQLSTHVVPAGTIRVESYSEGRDVPEVHEVALAAGEEKELVLGRGE